MPALLPFPATEAMFARLTERQRELHRAEEKAELLATAVDVLHDWQRYPSGTVRAAISMCGSIGDAYAIQMADKVQFQLNAHERIARNKAAQSSWAVVKERRSQWPQIITWGAVVATAMLAATGFLG